MCDNKPAFAVKIGNKKIYLCGKCIIEHDDVIVEKKRPSIGKKCECKLCK